jgi:sugar lactone lactonase YvrE
LAQDAAGNIYTVEGVPGLLRKTTPDGAVTKLAGDGQIGYKDGKGAEARFKLPYVVTVAPDGTIYIAEYEGLIRKSTPDGDVTTYAGRPGVIGSNQGTSSVNGVSFAFPAGLLADNAGQLFIADTWNNSIRWIEPQGKTVSTLVGTGNGFIDGPSVVAKLNHPAQIAVDGSHNFYVADSWNNSIRKITPQGFVTTLAGDGYDGNVLGKNDRARLKGPQGVAVTLDGSTLYVADTSNNRILKVTLHYKDVDRSENAQNRQLVGLNV